MVKQDQKAGIVDKEPTEGTGEIAKDSFFARNACKISVIIAILVPLLMLQILRESAFSAENSVDCYYHIAMADQGPGFYLQKTFPKLTMSVWTEKFSDKEMFYHFLLSLIRSYQNFLNLSLSPPFNFPALFFIGFLITAFVYTAHYFKIKNLVYYSLLLIFICPFFTNRILMLRPHTMSIALMLLCCPLVDSIKEKRLMLRLFVFSAFVAWCYSNPHFILLPVVAFSVVKFKKDHILAILLPLVCIAGIAFGYLFHPQFPNTFINWKIQCIDVVYQALQSSRVVAIGTEFSRPGWIWMVKNLLPFILLICCLLGLINLYAKRSLKLTANVFAFGIISTVAMFAVFLGIRAMEYAVPFSLLFAGSLLLEYKQTEVPLPEWMQNPKIVKYGKILIISLAIAFLVFQSETLKKKAVIEPLDDFAGWVQEEKIPKNTTIANLVWSDFPFLIYSCPQFNYLSGIDPMFSYAVAPEKVKKIEQFRIRKLKLTPKELSELVNARYAFVRKPYNLGKVMEKRGFIAIYHGKDGWLFDLDPKKNLEKTQKKVTLVH